MDNMDPILQTTARYPLSASVSGYPSVSGLGKPVAKKRVHAVSILAACISFICLASGITAVENTRVSWRLGQGTNQLIVLGFLLSIMNLCLGNVSTTLFLLIEARHGKSTLQNYDGLLRTKIFASRLSYSWTLVLAAMMALPVGLSVAYKRFAGGMSSIAVDPADYVANNSYYGMFSPAGLQNIGYSTGISLFDNATLDFSMSSAPPSSTAPEPELPQGRKTYGYNVLLLSNESSAVLDLPQPDYITRVQSMLALGESCTMRAPVFATVATLNHSKQENLSQWNETFLSECEAAKRSSGAYSHQTLMNEWSVDLVDHASPSDQSYQYIGITPDYGIDHPSPCWHFSHYAQQFDVNRQQCEGMWTITRGDVSLVDGVCNGSVLPPEQQLVITNNVMFLGVYYMQPLMEMLGTFSSTRNQSGWAGPYYATAVATMLWSRIVALNNPVKSQENGKELIWETTPNNHDLTYEEVGLVYSVHDTVMYARPVLLKSPWLFFVLALQPSLLALALVAMALMHSTPLDKGFWLDIDFIGHSG